MSGSVVAGRSPLAPFVNAFFVSLLQNVCPSNGGVGRRDGPSANCHEGTQVSNAFFLYFSDLQQGSCDVDPDVTTVAD